MSTFKNGFLALATLVLLPIFGHAQELEIGHLETSDDTGINWLYFHCNQTGDKLACDVFQTLISHKIEPGSRDSEINKKLSGDVVAEFKTAFGEACKNMDKILPAVTKAAETGVGVDGRSLNPRQAQDTKKMFQTLSNTCDHMDAKSIRQFVELEVDQDIHTCMVINNYSHMNFTYDSATGQWISKEGPIGPCGSVSVATLEKDKKTSFWLYTEKVIRTNPEGALNGLSCSKFPDRTMHYTWRAADNYVECTHVQNAMH